MKFIIGLIFLFPFVNYAQVDTVVVIDSLKNATQFYPGRSALVPKLAIAPVVDSIRVGESIINECNKRYYLIVKDAKGNKRLEGFFFGEYADGYVIEYDEKGRKRAEGNYEMIKSKKPVMIWKIHGKKYKKYIFSQKAGDWKYYNERGELLKKTPGS